VEDCEAAARRSVVAHLGKVCECMEEAPVELSSGHQGRVDVLCRPRHPDLHDLSFAVEVKGHKIIGDADLGLWLAQCAAYVGAEPQPPWPPVVATFAWLVGVDLYPDAAERLRMDGMIMLAQRLRVGLATDNAGDLLRRPGLVLRFGPSCEVFASRTGGWRPKARERLLAKRGDAGVRRKPVGRF
jgi:hypothetical protein